MSRGFKPFYTYGLVKHHPREKSYRVWTVVRIEMHNGTAQFVPMHEDEVKERKLHALAPFSYHLEAVRTARALKATAEVMDE